MRPIDCTATEILEQGVTLKVASVFGIPETFDLVIGDETKRHQCKVIQKTANKLRVAFLGHWHGGLIGALGLLGWYRKRKALAA